MKKIKILFVEDHEMVREGIKLMLTNQGSFKAIIEVASDGLEAISKIMSGKYDMVLLDVNLPKKDGIEVVKHLFAKGKNPKVLALSMHEEDYIIKNMIQAGALGYINKNSGIEELTKAIITVSEGNPYYSNEVAQVLLNNFKSTVNNDIQKHEPVNLVLDKGLSKREIQILQYLAKDFNNKEIAEKLNLSYRTIGNHRFRIMQKLEIHTLAGLISFAHDNGLV